MSSRRTAVRRSGVHGKGVFATEAIAAGERLIEYKGERISWKEALRRHPHDPQDPNHTFYFALDGGDVIDGKVNGNSARWINHSCAPNCEAEEIDGRVFIHAKRDVAAGVELFYDYGLVIEGRQTKKLRKEYECRCGAKNCRGTMLAPKPGKAGSGTQDANARKSANAGKAGAVGKGGEKSAEKKTAGTNGGASKPGSSPRRGVEDLSDPKTGPRKTATKAADKTATKTAAKPATKTATKPATKAARAPRRA